MRLKTFFAVFITFCIFLPAVGEINARENKQVQSPLIFIPEPHYNFTPVVEGKDIIHKFVVKNKGSSTLKIEKVRTG